MFPHCNSHNYISISPEGKTHNQIDHVLTDRKPLSSILDIRPFKGVDFDMHHYLVAANVRETLAVGKQAA
jgi:hypothetical protein